MSDYTIKAFPTTSPLESWGDPNQGMDLRDYFAAKAMELFINKGQYYVEETAKLAYAQADAMMKAREK